MSHVDALTKADHARIEARHLRMVVIVRQSPGHGAVKHVSAPTADDVQALGRRVVAVREEVDVAAGTNRSQCGLKNDIGWRNGEVLRNADAVLHINNIAVGRDGQSGNGLEDNACAIVLGLFGLECRRAEISRYRAVDRISAGLHLVAANEVGGQDRIV